MMFNTGNLWLATIAILLAAGPAFGAEGNGVGLSPGLIGLGAAMGLGIAAMGAGLAQGRATAAAMEAIGRNPNAADGVFVPLILGLALMEALALYALVLGFLLVGRI